MDADRSGVTMPAYHHIVLFRLHDPDDLDDALEALAASRPGSGLLEWTVTPSLDVRKGTIVVERAVFANEADFTAFRESDAHRVSGEVMAKIADWWVGDYLT